jgi:hypothetical protein
MDVSTQGLQSAAKDLVMHNGSRAFRALGTTTSHWRPMPDFLLIGGKRAGSTSLFFALGENPHVLPLFPSARHLPKRADSKGVHYFDSEYLRSDAWYRGHMPTAWARERAAHRLGGPVVVGEGSPYYLFHPFAPVRAYSRMPEAKIVVILRDPVMRCYSHWKEQTRNGVETLPFPAALAAEESRLDGELERMAADSRYRSFAHENQSYAAQSDYGTMLPAWVDRFSSERVLVLLSEDFYREPQSVVDAAADFLQIPRSPLTSDTVWNAAPGRELDPHIASELAERFQDTREYVEKLLQREVPWIRPS